jgi:hypothetical protein
MPFFAADGASPAGIGHLRRYLKSLRPSGFSRRTRRCQASEAGRVVAMVVDHLGAIAFGRPRASTFSAMISQP